MTEQIYNSDAYKQELESKIIEINEDYIVLDKTIFFPGGGGQPNDIGFISLGKDEIEINKVSWKDGKIAHFFADLKGLSVGDTVLCSIDWDRRFKLMRTHTALHILCGVVWRDFGALVTGGNMEPLKARMDFELESMSVDFAEKVEEKINEEVLKGHKIDINMLPREEALKIPDLIRTKIDLLPKHLVNFEKQKNYHDKYLLNYLLYLKHHLKSL